MSGYTITELAYPDSDETMVSAENNSGHIVGIYFGSTTEGGFLYDDGRYSALQPPNLLYGQPEAINDYGDIAGVNFATINGIYRPLDMAGSESSSTFGLAINNGGTVAGFYIDSVSGRNGFLYADGQYTQLSDPNAKDNTSPTAINDAGTVIGYYQDAERYTQGFLYQGGTYTTLPMPADAYRLLPLSINASGEVVGTYEDDDTNYHAFTYSDGILTTLPALAGASDLQAIAVNDRGVIVGDAVTEAGVSEGFVFNDGTFSILQDPQATRGTELVGINNAGTIIGTYVGSDGTTHSFTASVSCFAAGTRLSTAKGDLPIEGLRPGDLVTTIDGTHAPIIWIGFRDIDCARHPHPEKVLPIRVAAGAFGAGRPRRDLVLSPDHAIFIDGILIPAKQLVNGTVIRQMRVDRISYFHLELARHNIILAEGLPTESYLDTGDRLSFANAPERVALHPSWGIERADIALRMDALGYAPLKVAGEEVERVRSRLARQPPRNPARAA